MSIISSIIIFSLLSGITVFLGGLLAFFFEKKFKKGFLKEEIIHLFIAFGTGIMLSAISFVLVPHGLEKTHIIIAIFLILLGGIIFYYLDGYIQKKAKHTAQIMAMLLDFIPESIALGALFAYDYKLGMVLALFIALQNLPESFNSYLELRSSGFKIKKLLIILFLLSFIGVIFSLLGYYLLSENPFITSALMLFASGGILYLIFQDIAPSLKYKNNRLIAIGVNIGFIVGIYGNSFT
ncbi:ZIP family metal transporter [Malaciobacter marinus]|uniref:ZIP family metal transporter n=2 Tax=Malaciobacter marinus TaxID=505249 RepID=UPI003C782D5A